jgi:peptidoglycan hydrolase-like protein with peptidoglycan-binding domain
MADEPDLRQGSTDAETNGWVTYLQQLLGDLYTGAIDGIFGPITDAAVREYQQKHELVVDGWVGPITWASLTGQQGDSGGGEGDVPQDLVSAGAPANFSAWTEEQKAEFFKYAPNEGSPQGESDEVAVAEITTDSEDGGQLA